MDALKLAFDTVIVGALALPWVAMGIYLFLGSRDGQIERLWSLIKENQAQFPPAVAAVLLFATAYSLGAAVSRVSGDFFNDEDLRMPLTENGIRASVYCKANEHNLVDLRIRPEDELPFHVAPELFDKSCKFVNTKGSIESCTDKVDNIACTPANELAEQIFHLQESALLMLGGDRVERLNQLHAQILVLRGAAFNGMLMCAFCLFGMCANQRATHRIAWIIPIVVFALGVGAMGFHYHYHWRLDDPPFMECAFITLGLVALSAVWKGVPRRPYATYFLLSLMLTGVAYFGWWWSEVLYDQQVLESFYAQTHRLIH